MLLESWIQDAVACCEKCGVTPPFALLSDSAAAAGPHTSAAAYARLDHDLISPTISIPPPAFDANVSGSERQCRYIQSLPLCQTTEGAVIVFSV